jgi:hypothetical protein
MILRFLISNPVHENNFLAQNGRANPRMARVIAAAGAARPADALDTPAAKFHNPLQTLGILLIRHREAGKEDRMTLTARKIHGFSARGGAVSFWGRL